MNDIIICSVASSGFMATPMRLSTLGLSNLLVIMHSSINVRALDNEISTYVHMCKDYNKENDQIRKTT